MKRMIIGVAILLSIVLIVPVAAKEVYKTIKVQFNTITVKINGSVFVKDRILYNGSVYVPLRDISEKLDKTVTYDKKTNTVNISDKVVTKINLSGYGYTSTKGLQLKKGLYTVRYTGQSIGFGIILRGNYKHETIVSIAGRGYFDGEKRISVEDDGVYYFQVNCDKEWTLEITKNN